MKFLMLLSFIIHAGIIPQNSAEFFLNYLVIPGEEEYDPSENEIIFDLKHSAESKFSGHSPEKVNSPLNNPYEYKVRKFVNDLGKNNLDELKISKGRRKMFPLSALPEFSRYPTKHNVNIPAAYVIRKFILEDNGPPESEIFGRIQEILQRPAEFESSKYSPYKISLPSNKPHEVGNELVNDLGNTDNVIGQELSKKIDLKRIKALTAGKKYNRTHALRDSPEKNLKNEEIIIIDNGRKTSPMFLYAKIRASFRLPEPTNTIERKKEEISENGTNFLNPYLVFKDPAHNTELIPIISEKMQSVGDTLQEQTFPSNPYYDREDQSFSFHSFPLTEEVKKEEETSLQKQTNLPFLRQDQVFIGELAPPRNQMKQKVEDTPRNQTIPWNPNSEHADPELILELEIKQKKEIAPQKQASSLNLFPELENEAFNIISVLLSEETNPKDEITPQKQTISWNSYPKPADQVVNPESLPLTEGIKQNIHQMQTILSKLLSEQEDHLFNPQSAIFQTDEIKQKQESTSQKQTASSNLLSELENLLFNLETAPLPDEEKERQEIIPQGQTHFFYSYPELKVQSLNLKSAPPTEEVKQKEENTHQKQAISFNLYPGHADKALNLYHTAIPQESHSDNLSKKSLGSSNILFSAKPNPFFSGFPRYQSETGRKDLYPGAIAEEILHGIYQGNPMKSDFAPLGNQPFDGVYQMKSSQNQFSETSHPGATGQEILHDAYRLKPMKNDFTPLENQPFNGNNEI